MWNRVPAELDVGTVELAVTVHGLWNMQSVLLEDDVAQRVP
jgi:hypothetical protein